MLLFVRLVYSVSTRAVAKLELQDYDGALLAIQASCNLSRNLDCAESLAVLARIYHCQGNVAGEVQALTNWLEQPLVLPQQERGGDAAKKSFALQNERRLAELRLQKLQFQLLAKKH